MQTTTKPNRLFVSSMNPHRALLVCVAISIAMAVTDARVAGAEKSAGPHPAANKPAHPSGSLMSSTDTNLVLLLQQEDFWVIEDEPVNHLAHASKALSHHDAKASASELRKAALFVKAHAARAEGAVKSDLQTAARKLESLADRIENGVVQSQDELANALATTYLTLARYHYFAAVKEQAQDDVRAMKRDIITAADYIENHLKITGTKLDQATRTLLGDLRQAGQSVEAAPAKAEAGTGQVLESLGKEIEELGRNLNGEHEPERGVQSRHRNKNVHYSHRESVPTIVQPATPK